MSKIKDYAEMFEPKLPRGINLWNVTPAHVFEEMRRESMKKPIYLEIYSLYPTRQWLKTVGPFTNDNLEEHWDHLDSVYPEDGFEIMLQKEK